MRVVLASTSPRRRELLLLLGVPFEIRNPIYEEHLVHGRTAKDLVAQFARSKADSVAQHDSEALVLASDTLIQLDGTVLGKPGNLAEARGMLRQIAGRQHRVETAVSLSCLARRIETTQVSTACVWMKPFDALAHERYLSTGDSLGKAGAYSIQGPGSELIERLEGDFTTVVGFPLRLVANLLAQSGVTVPVDIETLYETKPYGNWPRFHG
jgi:septum formation protein